MDIQFTIEMPRPTVRGAAQILGSLALMRDGVRLMVNGGYEEFTRELSYVASDGGRVQVPLDDLAISLERVGKVVLYEHDWPVLPPQEHLILTQALLQMPSPENDLQLVSVGAGSLDGVIKDALEYIGGFFRGLLDSTNSIVQGGEGAGMKEVLGGIANVRPEARASVLGAGVAMVAAENLRRSFETHGVLGVKVY